MYIYPTDVDFFCQLVTRKKENNGSEHWKTQSKDIPNQERFGVN